MDIFGVGMALLGGAYALVVTVLSADTGGRRQERPTRQSQRDTEKENDTTDN